MTENNIYYIGRKVIIPTESQNHVLHWQVIIVKEMEVGSLNNVYKYFDRSHKKRNDILKIDGYVQN